MRNVCVILGALLAFPVNAVGQGRPLDWSFYGGDAQRTGWEKSDYRISKDNVKDFQLVLKHKLAAGSLTPPVVIGNLISYRGFKELGFVAGSSGGLWAIDVDTDRVFWEKQLEKPAACAGAVTMALTPPTNFAARPAKRPANRGGILGGGGFGAARPAFALSGDGKLHLLNTSNGDDLVPAIPFVPANSNASALTISEGMIYTTTGSGCGGGAGVWALDLGAIDPKKPEVAPPAPVSFRVKDRDISRLGGLAMGTEGTVYVQTGSTVLALGGEDLKPQKSFAMPAPAGNPVTPVVFDHKGADVIVAAGGHGVLYLLDSRTLTALHETPALGPEREIRGGLASWLDPSGTRWVLAPVWDSANSARGSIAAFKLEEQNGKPVLTQGWVAADIDAPEPPVIASGIVFALASGGHARLYALDGLTGQQLYSTGDQVSARANQTGLTAANGRVYFTTNDGMLYGFGIFLER